MGRLAILTEKSSAAKNFAKALGGMKGTFEGQDYVIVHASGHLLELKDPHEMVPAALRDKYAQWDVASLPWSLDDFTWANRISTEAVKQGDKIVRRTSKYHKGLLDDLAKAIATCDGVVGATDLDPSGEGAAICWNIVRHLGVEDKKLYRMEFLDESEKSIQKAFRSMRPVSSIDAEGEFRKAQFRNRWDMLSMQFTRAASKIGGSTKPLRNGRLKSSMVVLVGDQLKAHNDYVKKPFFENRFRDENGVVYSDPDVDRFEDEAQVPGGLSRSPVVNDGVSRKKTAPPKLLALSGLGGLLGKKGYPAAQVLETYQTMYESPNNYLSYPRTEDRFVSPEQFNEMLPLVDGIAKLVGVDPALLTQRTPRKTHVKTGGAHGANRPGLNVPTSLDALEAKFGRIGREIYEVLAKNYLRMLAPDYEYDQHKGHVQDYPSYTGTLSVPMVAGWKGVFTIEGDSEEDEETSGAKGLGTMADPFVHEGYPPRPPHPTQDWLTKQLERRNIGTGATQMSTYAEVTKDPQGKGLLVEGKGTRLTLSPLGELGYAILPGTNIGSLDLTKRVFDQMKEIDAGTAQADDYLAQVETLVREDIETMKANMSSLSPEITKKLEASGVYRQQVETFDLPAALHYTDQGKTVTKAKRVWSGYRFTDAEVAALCRGEEVQITATSARTKNEFTCKVRLVGKTVEYKGKQYPTVTYEPRFEERETITGTYKGKEVSFAKVWAGHEFTAAEATALLAGEAIEFEANKKSGGTFMAKGSLGEGSYNGKKTFGFQLDTSGWKSGGGKGGKSAGPRKGGRR